MSDIKLEEKDSPFDPELDFSKFTANKDGSYTIFGKDFELKKGDVVNLKTMEVEKKND